MIKIYKHLIKCLLLFGICITWFPIWAQQTGVKQEEKDSLTVEHINEIDHQPTNALFELNNLKSTASISTIKGDELYKTPTSNLSNTFYGLLPGLTVLQGSGEPGYDQASLWIRGIGSLNYGDYTICVDGFQTTFDYMQYLSPSEIESISVLKDAAALAPFGMKGANGVIWITTKRGKIGKSRVSIKARTGFQSPENINRPLGSYQYASLYNEAISNDNGRIWSPVYSDSQLQNYKNGTGVNTSWYDEVLKKEGQYTSAEATFTGGDTNAKYFVLLGYMRNSGLYNVQNDDTHSNAMLGQFNLRTNLDFNLFKIFEGKVDIGGRTMDKKYPNYSGSTLWNNLAKYPSNIYNPKNDNGTWAGTSTYPDNPLASIRELGYYSNHDRTLQANFTLKEKLDFLTQGLYLQEAISFSTWTRGTYNVTKNYGRYLNGSLQTTDQNTNYSIYDDYGTDQWYWTQYKLQLGYRKRVNEHELDAAINFLQYTYRDDANLNGNAGLNLNYAYQNLGGRIHYDFNNKYSTEFGFAYSGSDNFAKGNRFVFYPTLSAAWIISNEPFLKNSKTFNLLKLRASAGKSGYDSFSGGRYLYQLYYTYNGSFSTGTGDPTVNGGMSQAYTPNPNISAESSMKYNVGMDMGLVKKVNLTIDAFVDKRSNIVVPDNSLMAVFGATPPYRNIGKVTNKGIDFNATYSDHLGKLSYQLTGIVSYNANKINYMAEIPPVTPSAARTGQSITSVFGYQADGFYDITDFNPDGSLISGLPVPGFGPVQPGDIKYKDVNGDSKIDERDMIKIGNGFLPSWNYSIMANAAYEGFDFQVLFQGVGKRDVNLLDAANQTVAFRDNGNVYSLALGRWAYYPEEGIDTRATATYPRLSTLDNSNNYRNSTFWEKNGAFIRLRNIEIGYTLPKKFLNKTGLSEVRFFANGVNLLTWSPLLKDYHIDPETMTGYAALKSFNIGFSLNY